MTSARRDLAWMSTAAALLVLGIAGWWRVPLNGRVSNHYDLPVLALWLAAAGIIAGVVWLSDHAPGVGWSSVATSTTLAVTAPLAVFPLVMSGFAGPVARAGLVLAALAVLPLTWTLAGWISRPGEARLARGLGVACVIGAIVALVGIGPTQNDGYVGTAVHLMDPWGVRWLLLAVATLVPGLAAAASVMRAPVERFGNDRAVISAGTLVGASVLPMITGLTLVSYSVWPALVIPVAAALAMVAILSRLAIGPLARSAGDAAIQRDVVVSASESERDRLATALHDGPLGVVPRYIGDSLRRQACR